LENEIARFLILLTREEVRDLSAGWPLIIDFPWMEFWFEKAVAEKTY
jgi:hypothetical protein